MLLWEALNQPRPKTPNGPTPDPTVLCPQRLPYDKRCAVVTKSGRRCRGRIKVGGEFCPLHDPASCEARRRHSPTPKARARRRLLHLPDGYLRKLTHRASVGQALDRLYRELRLGIVSPEMGAVLFNILTRLLDSGLVDSGKLAAATSRRSKADRLRPKLADFLTRTERIAWRKAVGNAPNVVLQVHEPQTPPPSIRVPEPLPESNESAAPRRALQAAS